MANSVTVLDDSKVIALCGDGAKFAHVRFSIDANYAQGGYDVKALLAAAGVTGSIAAVLPMGPAFVDTPGGNAYSVQYYPSAGKLMFMDVTQATGALTELSAGALGGTYKLDAMVFHG